MLILVTGAMGKVGRHFMAGLLGDPRFSSVRIPALSHNHSCDETDHVGVVRGSISERHFVAAEREGVTHSVNLADWKEPPDDVMNVTVVGFIWTLEGFRATLTDRQFLLIGGDAGIGHFGSAWNDEGSQSDRHVVRYAG